MKRFSIYMIALMGILLFSQCSPDPDPEPEKEPVTQHEDNTTEEPTDIDDVHNGQSDQPAYAPRR